MRGSIWALCLLVGGAGALACAGARNVPHKDAASGIDLVFVKGGCFRMGTPEGLPGSPDERPAHEVCVGDFFIGRTEVTQAEWSAVMGTNPAEHKQCGADCPVEMISWNDAQAFIAALNARPQPTPGTYRLPTEAEWEFAARSRGKDQRFAGRNDDPVAVAWCYRNAPGPHAVGQKAPNDLGLVDMSGNVWEWTGDFYDPEYYGTSPRQNPTGPASGQYRVLRGGSYANDVFDLRTTYRNYLPPDYRSGSRGFRVVRTVPAK